MVSAVLLTALAGCASGDSRAARSPPSTSPSSSGSTSPTEEPSSTRTEEDEPTEDRQQAVEVAVVLRDGTVRPRPRRVDVAQGSTVRLAVTSDVDDAVHVHGFEIEEELEAGRTTSVEFVADQSGVFEVETHDSELELLQLEVR